jgi:hypothetical protein
VDLHAGGRQLPLLVTNVSRHGVFVEMESPPPERHLVRVTLKIPSGPAVVTARVAHRRPPTPGGPSGMGLHFFAVSVEVKERWDAYVQSLAGGAISHAGGAAPASNDALYYVRMRDPERLRAFFDKNVKVGAMTLVTPLLRDVGSPVSLVLVHPLTNNEYVIRGDVESVQAKAPKSLFIRFRSLPATQVKALEDFIVTGRSWAVAAEPSAGAGVTAQPVAPENPAPRATAEDVPAVELDPVLDLTDEATLLEAETSPPPPPLPPRPRTQPPAPVVVGVELAPSGPVMPAMLPTEPSPGGVTWSPDPGWRSSWQRQVLEVGVRLPEDWDSAVDDALANQITAGAYSSQPVPVGRPPHALPGWPLGRGPEETAPGAPLLVTGPLVSGVMPPPGPWPLVGPGVSPGPPTQPGFMPWSLAGGGASSPLRMGGLPVTLTPQDAVTGITPAGAGGLPPLDGDATRGRDALRQELVQVCLQRDQARQERDQARGDLVAVRRELEQTRLKLEALVAQWEAQPGGGPPGQDADGTGGPGARNG